MWSRICDSPTMCRLRCRRSYYRVSLNQFRVLSWSELVSIWFINPEYGKNGFLLHRMTHFIYIKFGGCRENVLSGRSCFIIAQCNLHAFHRAAVTKRSRDLAFHSPHSCYQWNSRDSWKKFAMYGVANRKFHVRRECNRGHTTRECYSITGRSCWCNRMTCWVKSGGVFHLQRHEYYHGTNDCNTKRVHTKLFYFCSNLHVDLTKKKKIKIAIRN